VFHLLGAACPASRGIHHHTPQPKRAKQFERVVGIDE
jgi:hypothetical protein